MDYQNQNQVIKSEESQLKNLTTLDQLSISTSSTTINPVAVLKHSYNLDRILEIENKGVLAVHLIQQMKKDVALKGIKDMPIDGVFNDILEMIFKRYSVLTPIEVELALQMERYGEFENKTEHYQFYGTEYVSDVLKKYVQWKQQKSMELNISRKPKQISKAEPDLNQINKEYEQTILAEIRAGNKHFRHIQAYLLYEEIPKDLLPTKEEGVKLYQDEFKLLQKELEMKQLEDKENGKRFNIEDLLGNNFENKLKIRCRNIVTCKYLAEINNIKTENGK